MASMAKLIGGKAPPMPEAPKATRMPVESDPDVLAAGARAREAAMKRTGRQSTILTDNLKNVAGGDYSRANLG